MHRQTALSRIHTLLTQPSFSAAEARLYGVSSAHIHYYINKELIRRLGRGIYRSSEYQENNKNFRWEDLIEVVHSIPRGVVCLISALAIYEITEEMPQEHWIAVPHTTSIHRKGKIKIVRFRNMEIGRTKIDLAGVNIPIFDRERTIIDAFRLLSRETAIKALKMAISAKGAARINLIKLQDYAKQLRFNIVPYLITVTT